MAQIKIESCFIVPAYRQVQSEEGPYEAHCGWNAIARSIGNCGRLFYWLYVGRKENPDPDAYNPPVVFGRESAARSYVDRLSAAGEINDRWWWCFQMVDPNELPDYVTHPERPEYN